MNQQQQIPSQYYLNKSVSMRIYTWLPGGNETDNRYDAKSFINNLNIPKQSEDEKRLCGGKILLNEC